MAETGQERHPDVAAVPAETTEKPPTIVDADRDRVSSTAVFLDNTKKVMDVDKCIPQDVIIDTGAINVMLSTKFANVVCVNFSTLNLGPKFVTAEGKVVAAMGATPQPLEFVLSRGTVQELRVSLHAIIVDTNVHCEISGMEFRSAVKGGYNFYT